MIKKLFQNKISRAGLMLAGFSFLADLMALLRDRILASHFGASRTLDIYYSAFKIPDLIFNLLVLGAVSSAFIPVFIEHYRQDQARAWRLTQNFLTVAFTGVLLTGVAMLVFIRPLASVIAPGFNGEETELLIRLMRLMLLSPILFSVSTILGSILQSLEKFLSYAIAPVLYNLGIIAGAVYFVPLMRSIDRPEVLGLGLGVVLGALLHLLVQLPAALKAGFRFRMIFDVADQSFRKIIRLMIPRTLGLGVYGIDTAVTNAIASTLGQGSIAMFNFANNLQFVPIAVVGVSMATAVFPRLSSDASNNDRTAFKKKLNLALINTFWIVALGAVGIYFLRRRIIKLFFGIGLFGSGSVEATSAILGIFMFGVIAQSLVPIMSRAFYALQNTKTPFLTSAFSILLNIVLGLWFTFGLGWGIKGLAIAFTISGNINFLLLYSLFRRKYF